MHADVMKYLQIVFHRKYLFVYTFLFTVIAVVGYTFFLPKIYVSGAAILIQEEKRMNPLVSGLAVSNTVAARIQFIREQILGWENLVDVVYKLDLADAVKSEFDFEQLIKAIRQKINVSFRGAHVVLISYEGQDPAQVHAVAKTLTDMFIEKNLRAQDSETELAFAFLHDQLNFYRQRIKEDEIKRLDDQLAKLLVDATERHPLVIQLRKQIERMKSELSTGNFDIESIQAASGADEEAVLSYLFTPEEKIQNSADVSAVREVLQKRSEYLGRQSVVSELLPDKSINKEIYVMLLKRLETARITQQLDSFKGGTNFAIIEPPRLPLKPEKPDKVMMMLLGLALGVGIGCGVVYLAEMMDLSYRKLADAKSDLPDLKAFGAISAILTEDDFIRRQRSAVFGYTFMGAIFVVIAAIVVAITFYL